MTEIVVTAEVDLDIVVHGRTRSRFRVEGHASDDRRGIHLCRLQYWRESDEQWVTMGEDAETPFIERYQDAFLAAVRAQWAIDSAKIAPLIAG
jgi:hypothetical protein